MDKMMGIMDLSDCQIKPLGYVCGGKYYLIGEPGPVSVERFNEVVGGTMPNGVSVTFAMVDDEQG